MDFCFSFAFIDYFPICPPKVRNPRLIAERHRLSPEVRFPAEADKTFDWDPYVKEVFKKLVEGVVGKTNNNDGLVAIVVKELSQ